MPMSADDAAYWSCRAAEARAIAAQMTDPLSRTAMLALAARYERLANRIEKGAAVYRTYNADPESRGRTHSSPSSSVRM
jgi:hypothetical protein